MMWLRDHWGWGIAAFAVILGSLALGAVRWTEREGDVIALSETVEPGQAPPIDQVEPERVEVATFAMG